MSLTFRPLEEGEAIPAEARAESVAKGLVIRDGDEVVGFCGVSLVVQIDPLWIRASHRGHSTLLSEGWLALEAFLREADVPSVFVSMLPGDPGPVFEEKIAHLCAKHGGEEFRGRVFILPIKPVPIPKDGG